MELNVTDVSDGTGIIEIDLVPSMMPIAIAIISVGGSALFAYILSKRSRNNQEQNEVQKIKDFLKTDFERLNNLSITNIEKMLEFIEQTQDDNSIDVMLTSTTSSIDYSAKDVKFYNFVYWSVLSNSGRLFKLNKDEISIIYDAHFELTEANSEIKKLEKEYLDRLRTIAMNTTLANRKESFKFNLKVLTHSILEQYYLVYLVIKDMDIPWLGMKQLSPANQEKLNSMLAKYGRDLREKLRNVSAK